MVEIPTLEVNVEVESVYLNKLCGFFKLHVNGQYQTIDFEIPVKIELKKD